MKQLLQNYLNGEMAIHDVPAPRVRKGGILVANKYSLISAGTERALVELARKSLIDKARSRPDLVRKVLDKVRTEGVLSAYQKSMQKLDSLSALGYSSAGIVLDVGDDVEGFTVGGPVACAGIGYASHAEVVFVPRNLAAPVPDGVDLAHASFTTVGAIALQGVRIADLRLGESAVVIGLGLIGLITAQILKAAGCHVVGLDLSAERCDLAMRLGCDHATASAEDLPAFARTGSGALADAALVTAASESDSLLDVAADALRDRGRVVVVGQVGMNVPRKAFYDKELSLLMSRSYGPGRYDRSYEEKGVDYPIGYVRWTENRNMRAFLELVAQGKVRLDPLLTHRYPIDEAVRAYDVVTGKTPQPHLGIVIEYDGASAPGARAGASAFAGLPGERAIATIGDRPVSIGVIGAGAFGMGTLLPALRETGAVRFASVVTRGGVTAKGAAQRFAFEKAVSDIDALLDDPAIDAVVITTRPDSHAALVTRALAAGKHVFVEKPLAIDPSELEALQHAARDSGRLLMVGFNRRYAPQVREIKRFLGRKAAPLLGIYRVNAGSLGPESEWQLDAEQGGTRLIGEAGHFVDVLAYLAEAPPVEVFAGAIDVPGEGMVASENAAVTIRFADGSVGVLIYTSSGAAAFSKERLEVFSNGRVAVLDDFRTLSMVSRSKRRGSRAWLKQDKGHREQMRSFVRAVQGRMPPPVSSHDYILTTWCTMQAVRSVRTRMLEPVTLASLAAAAARAGT